MNQRMKVHLFKVVAVPDHAKLTDLLEEISNRTLEDRVESVGLQEMRLEALEKPNDKCPYWLLDFTTMRFENGPGKISKAIPIEGFDLAANEGFGEETAAMFDEKSGYFLVQYNHHGPRANAIAEYLSMCMKSETTVFSFQVKLKETAEARLHNKPLISKIHCKIASPSMSSSLRKQGAGLNSALSLSDNLDGKSIEIIISAGRQKALGSGVHKILKTLRSCLSNGEDDVEVLRVGARKDLEDDIDEIDFIKEKEEFVFDGLELGPGRRFTRHSRWSALKRGRNHWKGVIK